MTDYLYNVEYLDIVNGDSIFLTDNKKDLDVLSSFKEKEFKMFNVVGLFKGKESVKALEQEINKASNKCNKFIVYCRDKEVEDLLLNDVLVSNNYKNIKSKKLILDKLVNGEYHTLEEYSNDDFRDLEFDLLLSTAFTKEDELKISENNRADKLITSFLSDISNKNKQKPISTGFNKLDKVLGGGLIPSKMYVLGAISSLGKTTLALQIMDNIAKGGNNVMLFSLEMNTSSILGRSLSRESYLIGGKDNGKSEYDITISDRHNYYSEEDIEVFNKAVNNYGEYSKNIYIYEGSKTAKNIYNTIKRFVDSHNVKPVVFVDYLQFITPREQLLTALAKAQVEDSISYLKQVKNDFDIPVFVISSFNRDSYDNVADMSSFKESGAIEYTADTIMALETNIDFYYKGVNKKAELIKDEFKRDPRELKLTMLKNRGGMVGGKMYFNYYPKYNYFQEDVLKNASENA